MLKEKLDKQFKLALWGFILSFVPIVGIIIMIAGTATVAASGNFDSLAGEGFSAAWIIGVILIVAGAIARTVLWILGIVNAVQISNITKDSVALLVLSIVVLWFGHLVAIVMERNKYRENNYKVTIPVGSQTSNSDDYESKLKDSFTHGVINSAEYEKKLKEYRSKK